MKGTIGIIAPMCDPNLTNVNIDFNVKFDKEELSVEHLYKICQNSFDISNIEKKLVRKDETIQNTIPAGGYYLEGLLRSWGYDTILVDSVAIDNLELFERSNLSVICISSTMISQRISLVQMVTKIRSVLPNVFIIIGGIFIWKSYCVFKVLQTQYKNESWHKEVEKFSIFPCKKSDLSVDIFIVSPHGIEILYLVLEKFYKDRNADYSHIPNLAIPNECGNYIFTQRTKEDVDYNNDITRWDLVEKIPFNVPIRTSIGCPYRCGFCDFWALYPKLFLRTKESILKELELVKNRDQSNIFFLTDDNCFFNQKRVDELCEIFINIKSAWSGFMRASSINSKNISKIKESGLVNAWIGIESGDANQLERMYKMQDIASMKNGIELLDKSDISSTLSIIVGYPGENMETLSNSAEFLNCLNTRNSFLVLFPFYLPPLSRISLMEEREKWNIKGIYANWSHSTLNSNDTMEYILKLFELVTEIPTYYSNEKKYFNSRLGDTKLKNVIRLRHKLSVLLMNGNGVESSIAQIFSDIAGEFGFNRMKPTESFLTKVSI